MDGDNETEAAHFQAVGNKQRSDGKRVGYDCGARRAANWAKMRTGRRRIHIRTKVKLCPKEHDGQEQRQCGHSRCAVMHLLIKTELRQDWLRGQAFATVRLEQPSPGFVRLSCYTEALRH